MTRRSGYFGKNSFIVVMVLSVGCTVQIAAQQAPCSTAATSWLWRAAKGSLGVAAFAGKSVLGAAVSHPFIAVGAGVAAGYALNQIPYTKPYMQKLYLSWSQFRCRDWHRLLQDTIGATAGLTTKMASAGDILSKINRHAIVTTNSLKQGVARAAQSAALMKRCCGMLTQGYEYVAAVQQRAASHIAAIHNQNAQMSDALVSALQHEHFWPPVDHELKEVIVDAHEAIALANQTDQRVASALQEFGIDEADSDVTSNASSVSVLQQDNLALLREASWEIE